MKRSYLVLFLWNAIPAMAMGSSDVPVRVYTDGNHSSLTDLFQAVDTKDDPLAGVPVSLLGLGQDREAWSDDEGRVVFDGTQDGLYLIRPLVEGAPTCTSRNIAAHLANLLATGAEKVIYVALGDSTPVYGAARPYPERLGEKVKALFPGAEMHNLAEGGTTTWDWLPGHWAFERAREWIATADLITVSLGGNDMVALAGLDFSDFAAVLAAAQQIIEQTLDNAALIVSAIREENPDADIVWTIYPNYARSERWLQYVPEAYIGLLQSGMEIAIGQMRERLAENPGLLLADIYEEWADEDIEPYMFDPIHVNDVGAESYARVIFRTLGGVLLPEDDGRERLFGFAMAPRPADEAGPEPEEVGTPEILAFEDTSRDLGSADGPVPGEIATSDFEDAGDPASETDALVAGDEASDATGGDLGVPDAGSSPDGPGPLSGSSGGGCRSTATPGTGWVPIFLLGIPWRRRRSRRMEPTGRIELPTR